MTRLLLAIAIALLGCCALASAQENAQTRIPDSLLDCYKNNTLYHRESRPPMTIATLIELIRKVEQYPGTNMDMRSLTISILHRFRLDGVEMNTEVPFSDGVIPFSVKGYQFFKHRILLRSFMQGSAVQFPNASLNAVELCAMHFLISNSIDKGQRGDEGYVCNRISQYRDRHRAPRSIADADVDPNTLSVAMPPPDVQQGNPDMEVETISPQNLNAMNQKTDEHNGHMFLDNDDNADGGYPVRPVPGPIPIAPGTPRKTPTRSGQPSFMAPILPSGGSPRAGNPAESECPVENGVIYTPYGAVTAGTLLAGIAAGLQPGDVNAKMLNPKASQNINVQNIYAATLAGDLAEMTLLQGPRYQESMVVGMPGGWNSTFLPRWYFNPNHNGKHQDQMTDPEIRGGLDGLIIAQNVRQWNSQAGNRLRLSQVLDMFYSNRGVYSDQKFRACNRKQMYSEVAPNAELELQTEGFAYILDPQMINEAHLDEATIQKFSKVAVSKLNNYIPSNLPSASCTEQFLSRATSLTGKMSPAIDLYLIVDTNWPYQDIQPLISGILEKLQLGKYESNVTIISGKEKKFILNTTNSFVDFTSNFTADRFNTWTFAGGMDVPGALDKELRELFEQQLEEDKLNNNVGGKPKIVLFIPTTGHSMSDNDKDVSRRAVQHFREKIPDVKFMFLAQGNRDRYTSIVEDPTKDIFNLQIGSDASSIDISVDPFVLRTRDVHRRVINPVCGRGWWTQGYGSHSLTEILEPNTVNYYRLHPNYVFASGDAKVKVQGYGHGDLKVCFSRRSEQPNNSTNGGDVTCYQVKSETVTYELRNACTDYTFVSQCPGLYIAIEDTGTGKNFQCLDNDCRYPDSIKYQISHEGLTCTGGVGRYLGSPTLLAIATLLIAAFKNSLSSH